MSKIVCPLREVAEKSPDRIVLIHPQGEISLSDFDRSVSRMALALSSVGVSSGDRVGLWLERSVDCLSLIMALIRLGAVASPISSRLPKPVVTRMLEQIGASTIITKRAQTEKSACREIQLSKLKTVCEEMNSTTRFPVELDLNQPATIIFSSGSASAPKAILHTLGNHYFNAIGANERIAFAENDRWLLSLPLYHVGGLAILFRALTGGGTMVLGDRALDLVGNINNHRITHISLVSTQLREMLDQRNDSNRNKNLKAVLLGGGPIDSRLVQKALDHKIPIATTYGLTEMTSQVTTSSIGISEPLTSGQTLDYRQLKVDDQGQIHVRGKCLFQGYVEGDQLRLPLDSEGWFATGDRGEFDTEGNLIVSGRIDNMFISGGENIYPEEIEAALMAIDSLIEAIVVEVADEKFGFRPVAFVRFDDSSLIDTLKPDQLLIETLPKYKIPTHFFPWPRTLTQTGLKPSRARLRQLAEETLSAQS